VADGLAGQLRLIDVSDPELPVELATYLTGDWVVDVAVRDSVAFVAAYTSGLRVIDVHDPHNMRELAWYDTPGHCFGLAVDNDVACLADGDAGLLKVRFDRAAAVAEGPRRPAALALASVAPNPFNPRTLVRYTLALPQQVELAVFDLRGTLVRELARGPRAAGEHQVAFDGSGLPSGLYLCRLRTELGESSRKMLLVK
jgi:hypothetical protein